MTSPDKQPPLRQKFNISIAESVADLSCTRKLNDNLNTPEILIREREDIIKTLTNPIKLHNVTDVVRNMPSDFIGGFVKLMKAEYELVRAVQKRLISVLGAQFAPITNVGNRFAESIRDNSPKFSGYCLNSNMTTTPNPYFHPDFREWRKECGITIEEDMGETE